MRDIVIKTYNKYQHCFTMGSGTKTKRYYIEEATGCWIGRGRLRREINSMVKEGLFSVGASSFGYKTYRLMGVS